MDAEGRSSTVYSKAKILKATQRPPHGSVRRQGSGDSGKAYPSSHRQPSAKPHNGIGGAASSTAAGIANSGNNNNNNSGGGKSSSSGKVPKPSVFRQRSNGGVGSSMESITAAGAADPRNSGDSSASITPSRRDSNTILVVEKVRPGESVASWQQRVMLQSWMKEEVVSNWVVQTALEQLAEHAHHQHHQGKAKRGAKKNSKRRVVAAGAHEEDAVGHGSFNQSSERSFEIDAEVGGIPSPNPPDVAPHSSRSGTAHANATDALASGAFNSKKTSGARSSGVRKSDDSSGGPSSRPTPSRRRNDRNSQESDNSNSNTHNSSSSAMGNTTTTTPTTISGSSAYANSARHSSESSGRLKLTSANLAAIEAWELAHLEASHQMFGPPRQLDIAVKGTRGGGDMNDHNFEKDHKSIASGPPPSPRAHKVEAAAATLSRASSFDSLALQRAAFLLEATLSDGPSSLSTPDSRQGSRSPRPLNRSGAGSSAGHRSNSNGRASQVRRSNGSSGPHQHRPFPEPAPVPKLEVGSSVALLPATLEDIAARFDAGGLLFNPADVGLSPGDVGTVLGFIKGAPKKSRKRSDADFGGAYDGSAIEAIAPTTALTYQRCLVVVKFKKGTFRLRTTQVARQEVPETRSEDDDDEVEELGVGAVTQNGASGVNSGSGGHSGRNQRPRSLSSGSNVVGVELQRIDT